MLFFLAGATGNDTHFSDTDLAVETDEPFITVDVIGAVDMVNLKTASARLKIKFAKKESFHMNSEQ